MSKRSRDFRPRIRWRRPLTLDGEFKNGPMQPNTPPLLVDDSWVIPPPISSRLYQKSALGRPVPNGSIKLSPEELLFCHWHRHIPLPSVEWLEKSIDTDPDLMYRAVAFEHIRSGGERLVPVQHLDLDYAPGTWCIRWSRDTHPVNSKPEAEVIWASTESVLDWSLLLEWAECVISQKRVPEIAIVDQEMEVTMYSLQTINPTGTNIYPERQKLLPFWKNRRLVKDGWFVPVGDEWPEESIGIEQLSGRFIRTDEADWINGIEHDEVLLLNHLLKSGLIVRPGFKYGCKWRVYDAWVEDAHAPWLLQMEVNAPGEWRGVCLSVRLAEGVHKRWICAMKRDQSWIFLEFQRSLPGRS